MAKRDTKRDFVSKARDRFGYRFDYSKGVYIDSRTNILIICPYHGEFWQRPGNHLGSVFGCSKCAKDSEKLTHKEFLDRAKEKHGDKYGYGYSKYKPHGDYIPIECSKHGWFTQKVNRHLNGHGCPKCGYESIGRKVADNKRIGKDAFIKRSKDIHGDKYDYSFVEYSVCYEDVEIICPIHGTFHQWPKVHLDGSGCPKCGVISGANKKRVTTEEFIKRAIEVHGDKYDYSNTEYTCAQDNLEIICKDHGIFSIMPGNHLKGYGCQKCTTKSIAEERIAVFLREREVYFEKEYTFDGCKDIDPLPFDFYIDLDDGPILLEYDGKQHFEPIDFFGGEERFRDRVKKDKIKNEFAKRNNINLIRISYRERSNLEDKLEEVLPI